MNQHEYDFNWQGFDCRPKLTSYANGLMAIQLIDPEDGMTIAVATVNIPEAKDRLPKDAVLIKDWSENKGVFEALVAAKIISPTAYRIPTGHVSAPVGFLNPEFISWANSSKEDAA